MESNTEKQTAESSIQDYLSLGYLYLLALGIIREVIYFGFLDINILSYSSVLDVLLSPLVVMTKNPKVGIGLIFFAIVIYFLNGYLFKKQQNVSLESSSPNKKEFTKSEITQGSIFLFSLFIFAFFVGTGIGAGYKDSKKLEKGEFEISHKITFIDQEKIEVKLLASNSQYIFYVLGNEKSVSISPISGNVKKIEKLASDD